MPTPKKPRPDFLQRLSNRQTQPKAMGLWRWPGQALEQLSGFLSNIWKVVIQLGLLILAAMLLSLLWDECHKTVAVIGRIEAPEELQKKGYAPQVLGNHLTDDLLAIDQGAKTVMPHQHAISDFQQPDVTLTDGFSLRAALRFLKQTLHHPDIQIRGDAIVDGDALQLRARVVDALGEVHTLSQSGKTAELETALNALAEQVMDVVDPYILGTYWEKLEEMSCQPKSACDYAKAVGQYQKIIANAGNDEFTRRRIAWAYIGWGYVHDLRGEHQDVAEKAELATRYDLDNATAYFNWGFALHNLGKHEEAIAQYRKAVELDPKLADAHYNWGNALYNLGEDEEAIAQYRKALELDPKYALAHNNLGKLLNLTNQSRKALELAQQALAAGLKSGDLGAWSCDALHNLQATLTPEDYQTETAGFACH